MNGATTMQRNAAAQTTITQSHVCDTSSCQPPLRSAKKLWRSPCAAAARQPEQRERGRADGERAAQSTAKTMPGIRRGRDHAGDGGPDHEGEAPREPEQRVRLLEPLRADRRRDEPGRRGLEERLRRSVDRHEHGEVPELGASPLRSRTASVACTSPRTDVGDEHDHLPRQAVRPDAAGEHEDDERQRLRGEHDAERGRAPSSVWMTAKASATGTSPSPSVEVACPSQSSRNRRSRSAPKTCRPASLDFT